MSLGSRTTARPDSEIEAALASNWICIPFGDPKSKHDSNLPRKLARRCAAAEEALRQIAEFAAYGMNDGVWIRKLALAAVPEENQERCPQKRVDGRRCILDAGHDGDCEVLDG